MSVITRPAATLTDTTACTARNRTLLLAPAAAVTVFGVVSLTQAFTREGFDLLRYPLSMLATGDLAWLQITTFLVTGLLTAIGGIALRPALRGGAGATWAPRLVVASGIGLMAAGVFTMDPGAGFPAGYDAVPTTMSWHCGLHLLFGSLTFALWTVACFVLGRRLSRDGHRGIAVAVRVGGAAMVLGNAWSIPGGAAGSLTICIGALASMAAIAVAALVRRAALTR